MKFPSMWTGWASRQKHISRGQRPKVSHVTRHTATRQRSSSSRLDHLHFSFPQWTIQTGWRCPISFITSPHEGSRHFQFDFQSHETGFGGQSSTCKHPRLLQCLLLILGCCTGTRSGQVFLQRDIVHLLGAAVLRLLRYGWVWVTDHVSREGGVHADGGGARAPINTARNKRGGACGRAGPCQVGLAAGAVVVEADDDGAVAVAAADHRALPLEGQVPACPCFLDLRLDLWERERIKAINYHRVQNRSLILRYKYLTEHNLTYRIVF